MTTKVPIKKPENASKTSVFAWIVVGNVFPSKKSVFARREVIKFKKLKALLLVF